MSGPPESAVRPTRRKLPADIPPRKVSDKADYMTRWHTEVVNARVFRPAELALAAAIRLQAKRETGIVEGVSQTRLAVEGGFYGRGGRTLAGKLARRFEEEEFLVVERNQGAPNAYRCVFPSANSQGVGTSQTEVATKSDEVPTPKGCHSANPQGVARTMTMDVIPGEALLSSTNGSAGLEGEEEGSNGAVAPRKREELLAKALSAASSEDDASSVRRWLAPKAGEETP